MNQQQVNHRRRMDTLPKPSVRGGGGGGGGHVAQQVKCLTADTEDTFLTANPGVASLILAQSHTLSTG